MEATAGLTIRIDPSRQLFAAVLVLHVFALLASVATAFDWPLRVLLGTVAGLSLWRELLAEQARYRGAPLRLRLGNGQWTLESRGVTEPVELLGDSTVWSALVVLRLRGPRDVHSLVLAGDSAAATERRRLRALLRLAPQGVRTVSRARGEVSG